MTIGLILFACRFGPADKSQARLVATKSIQIDCLEQHISQVAIANLALFGECATGSRNQCLGCPPVVDEYGRRVRKTENSGLEAALQIEVLMHRMSLHTAVTPCLQ